MSVAHRFESWHERIGGTAVLFSILIHVILAVLIFTDVLMTHEPTKPPAEPEAIEVNLVPEPKKPLPPPQKVQEPLSQPEQEPPKPEPKPEQPPLPKPIQQPPVPPKTPPKPVLEEGKLGKESKAPKHNWLDDVKDDSLPKEAQAVNPFAKATEPMNWSKAKRLDDVGPATQTERDFLLSQVVRHWRNRPNFEWPSDAVVQLRVKVLPNGHLATPFNASEQYVPEVAISGYEGMGRGDPRRALLESLYVALRVAQPFTLTPELKAKAPFDTVLDFKLSDVP